MDDRERRLAFSREDVAEGTVTKRIELQGVDVESVHGRLRSRLAEAGRFASFEDGVRSTLEAEPAPEPPEARGGASGGEDHHPTESAPREGRLSVAFGRETEDGTIEYRPYGPHGAMAMLVGAIFALPTLFVTLLLAAVGYLLYRVERPAAVPFERVTLVDVLVTEGANRTRDPQRTDGPGTVSIVATAEPGYAVDSDRLSDLEWPHRKAILAHVRDWKRRALEGEPGRETADDAFFSHLNMCWNRRASADVAAIDDEQRAVFDDREGRRIYADRLRGRVDRDGNDDTDATATPEERLEALLDDFAASERT